MLDTINMASNKNLGLVACPLKTARSLGHSPYHGAWGARPIP